MVLNLLLQGGTSFDTPFSGNKKYNVISYEGDAEEAEDYENFQDSQQKQSNHDSDFNYRFSQRFRNRYSVRITHDEIFDLVQQEIITEEQGITMWQQFEAREN